MAYWSWLNNSYNLHVISVFICLVLGATVYTLYRVFFWSLQRIILSKIGWIPQLEVHVNLIKKERLNQKLQSWHAQYDCIRDFLDQLSLQGDSENRNVEKLFLENSIVHMTAMTSWLMLFFWITGIFTQRAFEPFHWSFLVFAFAFSISYISLEQRVDRKEALLISANQEVYISTLKRYCELNDWAEKI